MNKPTEQDKQLERVKFSIADLVIEFCGYVLKNAESKEFYARDLCGFVQRRGMDVGSPVAPESPARVLRILKRERRIDVENISRRQSLYRITAVRTKEQALDVVDIDAAQPGGQVCMNL